jgi:hypothetical protein
MDPAGALVMVAVERTALANEGANMANCRGGVVLPVMFDAAQG